MSPAQLETILQSQRDFLRFLENRLHNANVRVHRARKALREKVQQMCGACSSHGCLDCTCSNPSNPRRKVKQV